MLSNYDQQVLVPLKTECQYKYPKIEITHPFSLTFPSNFFSFDFCVFISFFAIVFRLTIWTIFHVAFFRIFRNRHWELFYITAIWPDITKIVVYIYIYIYIYYIHIYVYVCICIYNIYIYVYIYIFMYIYIYIYIYIYVYIYIVQVSKWNKIINLLKIKSFTGIFLGLWSCNFTEKLFFFSSCEWLLPTISLINVIKKSGRSIIK